MTDNEIIKALEYCESQLDCCNCKCLGYCPQDINELNGLALDLINRQKAEIERLCSVVDKTDAAYFQKVNEVDKAKAEAIKEALSRVETELGEYYIAKHLVVGTVLDKVRKEMVGDVG